MILKLGVYYITAEGRRKWICVIIGIRSVRYFVKMSRDLSFGDIWTLKLNRPDILIYIIKIFYSAKMDKLTNCCIPVLRTRVRDPNVAK
jgi:hypothetical protein